MSDELSHKALAGKLAAQIRGRTKPPIVFEEIALAGTWGSAGRVDVAALTIRDGYEKVEIAGYEVKASRADLLGDLDSGKWEKYLPCLSRFYFAIRSGIAKLDEIPEVAGVLSYVPEKGVWRQVRRPAAASVKLNPNPGALLRMIRRMDYDAAKARNAESRLGRMERLARMEREEELAVVLAERVRRVVNNARFVQQRVDAQLAEAEAKLEAAEGLEGVLGAAAAILGHASRAVSGVRWGGPAADDARKALVAVAEAIEAHSADLRAERAATGL